LITQSIPLTVTQRSVVGPGTFTPQRRITREGSPHTAVAWLFVLRSAESPIASGKATIMGAHAGFAASRAAGTSTAGEHAAKAREATIPVNAILAARAGRESCGRCIRQDYRRCPTGPDTVLAARAAMSQARCSVVACLKSV
jgi:hypothetical protein